MPSLFDNTTPEALKLSEFNARITDALNLHDELQRQWVKAETIDVTVRRGHCYMELIEKDPDKGDTVARVQAVMWAGVYNRLAAQFQKVTGQAFASGMKVMVCVTATFHQIFGMKLVINDINPEFTLGDMQRQRQEILDRLKREGIIDMNKTLTWPRAPQRIAVVSASGAAGYGDFINQLNNNAYHLPFYTCLFTAAMQGANTVPSVLQALDRINSHIDLFDCVVVIRGGGSTSDLNSFDNYDLAAAIAQFPIPVIVGIGHERDVTVLDYVAAMRVKTPTAAAEWLIQRGSAELAHITELGNTIVAAVRETLGHSREQLTYYTSLIPATARRLIDTSKLRLDHYSERILENVNQHLLRQHTRLETLTDKLELLSPRNILNRGYSLTMCKGRFITKASQLQPGDTITVHFSQGSASTTVLSTKQ